MTNKRNKINRLLTLTFLLIESLLFYLIHVENANLGFSLHYAVIILATAFAWLTLFIKLITTKENNESPLKLIFGIKDGNLLRIAMLFTLAADYFLVFLPEIQRMNGMLCFLGTQLFIFLHLVVRDENPKSRRANIITRVVLSLVLVLATFIVLGPDADKLALVSIIYYANLLTSMIFAPKDKRGGFLMALGLALFALCDINVGLSVLNDLYVGGFPEGSILHTLVNSDIDLAWIFYIPSQVLIPLTLLCGSKKES